MKFVLKRKFISKSQLCCTTRYIKRIPFNPLTLPTITDKRDMKVCFVGFFKTCCYNKEDPLKVWVKQNIMPRLFKDFLTPLNDCKMATLCAAFFSCFIWAGNHIFHRHSTCCVQKEIQNMPNLASGDGQNEILSFAKSHVYHRNLASKY